MERYRKLAYDVGVNVLANLIAAAVIYLLGAIAGLFPREPVALTLTLVLLGTVTLLAFAVVVDWRWPRSRLRRYLEPIVFATLAVAAVGIAINFGATSGWALWAVAIVLAVAAAATALGAYRGWGRYGDT